MTHTLRNIYLSHLFPDFFTNMRSGILILVAAASLARSSPSLLDKEGDNDSLSSLLSWYDANLPHHRDKRFLWMSEKKKMVLPPGTQLVLTPTLAMPFIRYPPKGLDANLTLSTPFTGAKL